jgi:hypothetical protein
MDGRPVAGETRAMRTARPLALLLALASPAAALAADVVALLPANGANVDPGTLSAAHDVFRTYVEEAGAFVVRLTRGGAVSPVEPSPSEAVASAYEVGAPYAAVLRLSMLGSVLHVRLTVYAGPDGRTVWFDSLQAGAPGDLDPVLKRLATGWARGVKASAAAEIDTVTEKEAKPYLKKQATRQRGFRLGGMRSYGGGDQSDQWARGGGVYWLYDARSFFVDVTIDYYGGRGLHNLATGFGGYLPLTRTDLAPYLGGGLRFAWTDVSGAWNDGFQPYVAGGLILGRLSSVGFRGEVSWHWNTYENAGEKASLLVGSLAVQF